MTTEKHYFPHTPPVQLRAMLAKHTDRMSDHAAKVFDLPDYNAWQMWGLEARTLETLQQQMEQALAEKRAEVAQ